MPRKERPISREISQLVDKQLRNWEIARAQNPRPPPTEDRPVADCIAVSRAVGLPAYEVGARLRARLGWPLFDKEILHTMAGDDRYRERLYANMDGRDVGWLEGFVRGLTLTTFDKDDYFHRLTATVLSIARQGRAIFVGRATHLILPRGIGLRIRLTAPTAVCVESYARLKQLSIEEASREVTEIEEERDHFVHNHFGVALADQTTYDLILNMQHFSTQQAVDMILSALRIRGIVGGLPPELPEPCGLG